MSKSFVRKIQIVSFLCAHIPFACVGLYLAYANIPDQLPIVGVMFAATLLAAILMWRYIGSALAGALSYEGA